MENDFVVSWRCGGVSRRHGGDFGLSENIDRRFRLRFPENR